MRRILALGVVAFVGCSSFASESGGGGDAGAPDAGTVVPGTPPGTDGGAAPFACAAHPGVTFCDDFEGRSVADVPWTTTDVKAGLATKPEIDAADGDPGASVKMEVSALAAGVSAGTVLEKDAPHSEGDVHLEYAMRVDALGSADKVWLSRLAFGGTDYTTRFRIWLYVEGEQLWIVQQGPSVPTSPKTKLQVELKRGTWVHVTTDISFSAKAIRASVDGSPEATIPFVPEAISGDLILSLGVDYVEGVSDRVAVHYDDVVLDAK